MGGGIPPVATVADPLSARGVLLLGGELPLVIVSFDWCEIRNQAFDALREAIAQGVRTEPQRVLLSCVHQHDAPVVDIAAERLLRAAGARGSICDLDFFNSIVSRLAQKAREATQHTRPVTHVGFGQASLDQFTSNRRYLGPNGEPRFDRGSTTRDEFARAQAPGTIDPVLRVLAFKEADLPIACLSVFATHPMSHYGRGAVSADFPGIARAARQGAVPGVFQVYASGCAGNITVGKYNEGAATNRLVFASRLEHAMSRAWDTVAWHPLERAEFRCAGLRLPPRNDPGFAPDALAETLRSASRPFDQCLAALGLSWRDRCDSGRLLNIPAIDFGPGIWLALPAESYVEYQQLAQSLGQPKLVITTGYSECGPGYIPTEQAFREEDTNLRDWCWVAPGCEAIMTRAIREAVGLS
jgi:hypothetical protein